MSSARSSSTGLELSYLSGIKLRSFSAFSNDNLSFLASVLGFGVSMDVRVMSKDEVDTVRDYL
jgi:hypothetical protein